LAGVEETKSAPRGVVPTGIEPITFQMQLKHVTALAPSWYVSVAVRKSHKYPHPPFELNNFMAVLGMSNERMKL
jgi:hypothetical protein